MRKFFEKPWVWVILAVGLISPVVVFWPLLVLALFPARLEIRPPHDAPLHADNVADLLLKVQNLQAKQLHVIAVRAEDSELQPPSQPLVDAGNRIGLSLWRTYLLRLQRLDGIPDKELNILRRDIRLLGLPDLARVPYEPEP
jgi:hypothetical protein